MKLLKLSMLLSTLGVILIVNPVVNLATAALPTPAATAKLFDDTPSKGISRKSKNLSFYFQHIEIRALLQLIAKNSGMNFIINDNVKGDISLNLKNVTWKQALNIVLETQGLGARRVGNIVYISTIDDITSTESKQFKSDDAIANMAPLKSAFLRLKYTNAADIATLLKGTQSSLLSSRGQVAVDARTNSLIIRDTKQNLDDLLPEIKKLDVPARQVLIEARIVNIDTTYEEELGVRFGTTHTRRMTGTLEGANSMLQGNQPQNITNVAGITDYTKRLNFNIPANSLFDGGVPGSIGLALAKIGDMYLDLELSALEGEKHAKVIARPRVVTSNQQKAVIQTGEEIPYQEATSSGATSVVFKKAVLSLEIVPQITPDNKVVLQLKATEDTRGDSITIGVTGGQPTTVPAINTQEVRSNVLLNNNETIVIGGVYKTVKTNTMDRIPFFGTLPVIGHLFSHRGVHNEKHELLIFITPKIIFASAAGKNESPRLEGEG